MSQPRWISIPLPVKGWFRRFVRTDLCPICFSLVDEGFRKEHYDAMHVRRLPREPLGMADIQDILKVPADERLQFIRDNYGERV